MVGLSTILTAVNDNILNAVSTTNFKGIEIVSKDFTDGIIRPSIRVLYNSYGGKFNKQMRERTLTVRVLFYAKDSYNYKLDNIDMQDIIENAFLEPFQVKDGYTMYYLNENGIEEGVTSEIVDTVLQCSFNLYSLEPIYDDSNLENMEDLAINLTENNANLKMERE